MQLHTRDRLLLVHRHDDIECACSRATEPAQDNIARWGCQVIEVAVEGRIGQERGGRLVRGLEERRWVRGDAFPVERLVAAIECLQGT